MTNHTSNKKGETPKAKISEVAQGETKSPETTDETQGNSDNLAVIKQPKNIMQASEQAWIEGTQSLQSNLIRGLQEYQTGLSGWKERGLLAQKRQQMISEVTEQYVRYLREEARISSDAALQARSAILQKQLHELKGQLFVDIADMAGVTVFEIEQVFQANYAKLTDPEIQKMYAQFVFAKIADLLDPQNLK